MNRVSGSCDQVTGNCTCFNGTVECGCNLGYELNNQSDYFVCQGKIIRINTLISVNNMIILHTCRYQRMRCWKPMWHWNM